MSGGLSSLRRSVCWREALLIAAGEVNKDPPPLTPAKWRSAMFHARRLANLEYLKSCGLENKVTGERVDLISKVMGILTLKSAAWS